MVGHHVGLQQPTQDAGGEGGMATPTLAGNGHPDRFHLLVHQHSFLRFGLRGPPWSGRVGTGGSTVITPPRPSELRTQGDIEFTGKATNVRAAVAPVQADGNAAQNHQVGDQRERSGSARTYPTCLAVDAKSVRVAKRPVHRERRSRRPSHYLDAAAVAEHHHAGTVFHRRGGIKPRSG